MYKCAAEAITLRRTGEHEAINHNRPHRPALLLTLDGEYL
jgi:hypothetical protein